MEIATFQDLIRKTYHRRDKKRGLDKNFLWFTEEVGELARALRHGGRDELRHEFSDVLAWLASLANLTDIDLDDAAGRYANGCPKCGRSPCECPFEPTSWPTSITSRAARSG
jgi:NTP pyrophosphatase (non-canonical NTP hydrolase)